MPGKLFTLLSIAPGIVAWGQNITALEKPVNITASNERITVFLQRLSAASGCVFSYSSNNLEMSRKITRELHTHFHCVQEDLTGR